MAGLSTNAPGLWGGFAGLLYGSTSLSTPPGFLADATPAWVLPGAALDLDFADSLGYNSRNLATTTPDSILTYTNPSTKMVYGSDGVLRYAPHNLLLQSQTFETASWMKLAVAVTGASINAAVAPDGTLTADKVVATNTANDGRCIYQDVAALGSAYVFSVYAKADEYYLVRLIDINGYRFYATFNLVTGLVSAAGGANYLSSSMTDVGGGWWRLTIFTTTITAAFAPSFVGFPDTITPTNQPAIYAGDGVSGVYFWGAQLQRTPNHSNTYIPTTTAAVYSLPIDHNPTTFAPLGVLIEEERKNLLQWSEQFDNAYWSRGSGAISPSAGISPSSLNDADKLIGRAVLNQQWVFRLAIAVANGVSHTVSCYMKADGYNFGQLRILTGGTIANVGFNLSTGTIYGTAAGSGTITDVGGGWYRCTATGTSSSTSADVYINVSDTADLSKSFTGDGTSGILIWGAQLEAGAFPTSYIPTTNNPLGVTRLADQVSILTSAFGYNAAAGTVVGEGSQPVLFNASNSLASLHVAGGIFNGRLTIYRQAAGTANGYVISTVPVGNAITGPSVAAGEMWKGALAFSGTEQAFSAKGSSVGTTSIDMVSTLAAMAALTVGASYTGAGYWGGHIKRLTYFPTRRTNADLQVLTRGDDLVWGIGDYLVWGSGNNLTW